MSDSDSTNSARNLIICRDTHVWDVISAHVEGKIPEGYPRIEIAMTPGMLKEATQRSHERTRSTDDILSGLAFAVVVPEALVEHCKASGRDDLFALGETGLANEYQIEFEGTTAFLASKSDKQDRLQLGQVDAEFMTGLAHQFADKGRSARQIASQRLTDQQVEDFLQISIRPWNQFTKLADNELNFGGYGDFYAGTGKQIVVTVSDEFKNHPSLSSGIYGTREKLSNNYYLKVLENNRLILGYQSIIGSIDMGFLSDAQLARIREKIQTAHEAYDLAHPPKEVAAAAPGTSTSLARSSSVRLQVPTHSLKDEIALLTAREEDNTIRLPKATLGHYDTIRARMLEAGGKYKSDRTGSYFSFPKGLDAPAVLETLQLGDRIKVKQETQFFATPSEQVDELICMHGDLSGKRVLEPSAGDGAIADAARARGATVVAIENWPVNVKILADKGYDPIERDFLTVSSADLGEGFDLVLMNPPFTKGQDMQHVRHALGFLTPDGHLSAITSCRAGEGDTSDHRSFSKLLQVASASRKEIPAGAFSKSGTGVATSEIHISMATMLERMAFLGVTDADLGIDLSAVREAAREQTQEVYRPTEFMRA